jgi:hypothetical protein
MTKRVSIEIYLDLYLCSTFWAILRQFKKVELYENIQLPVGKFNALTFNYLG